MIDDIRTKINDLAARLVTLDRKTQNDEIVTLTQQVYCLFLDVGLSYKETDRYGNDWYVFPILDNLCAPFDTVLKALEENLRESKKTGYWIFQPQNGEFIQTIIKKVKYKVQRRDGMLKGYIPESEYVDSDNTPTGKYKESKDLYDKEDEIDDLVKVLSARQFLAYIAELIICQEWVEKGKDNKQHFEGFFTHDVVTEERKSDGIYITDEYSALVFPAMSIFLLNYLMEGRFDHMRDLVTNDVRDGINLSQRVENVGRCFSMKSPKYFHGQYKKWLKSIKTNKD